MLFDETERNHIFDSDKPFSVDLYDFALSEDAMHCALWDREQKILMVYDMKKIYDYDFFHKNCHCKGFRVLDPEVSTIFELEYIDYWGGNSKDILNVSRSILSHQQSEKNKTIFKTSALCLAQIYYEVLKYGVSRKKWAFRYSKIEKCGIMII